MAKAQKLHRFVFKLNTTFLAKHKWNLTFPINEARKSPGCVVSLSDSQVLTWISEINGTENNEVKAKEIVSEIKYIKKQENSIGNKRKIKELYDELYRLQFIEDYMCLVIDKNSDYDRANKGFFINGIKYRRFLATTGGVKSSTIIYVSERIYPILKRRLDNGRKKDIPLVPAKLEAYQALVCSGSIPVSWPRGIIVVNDCFVKFRSDIVLLDDTDETREPVVTNKYNEEIEADVSDGCSIMLPSLSQRWNKELDPYSDGTMSGCNLRCSWLKGMTFTFDYISWARKNKTGYIVKDVWGNDRDIRDSELIITESQLKGWSWYSSWESYYNNCLRNHYTIRVAKTAPKVCDNIRQLNYQFINPYELTDEDIQELIAPTVNEIKDIIALDPIKSILYLCGTELSDDNVLYSDIAARALMIDNSLLNDGYVRDRIKKMISKRIREAKIGVLDIEGNYQIISGDPVALLQNMFNLPITGILKAGELYSKYWIDRGCTEVTAYRAPMSTGHNICRQKICYNEDAQYWFKYIDTCIIVNAWDTLLMAESGADCDGDLLCTTNNPVLLRRHVQLPALCCVQKKTKKAVVTEEDIIISNKNGFGNEVGSVTNKTTSQVSLRASFPKDSEEYKILTYRIQCGQNFNQNAVDKCKGVISKKMPLYWYDKRGIRFNPEDTKEEHDKKELYWRICSDKKPYFFSYLYPDYKQKNDHYKKVVNENAGIMFGKTLEDLLSSDNLNLEEKEFINSYEKNKILDESPSVMNRICWAIENVFDSMSFIPNIKFDFSILESGNLINEKLKKLILNIYDKYKKESLIINKSQSKKSLNSEITENGVFDRSMLIKLLAEEFFEICPNEIELCDILIELCYNGTIPKNIVWTICGDQIIRNLLKKNDGNLSYPLKDKNGDIYYHGDMFKMRTLNLLEVSE